MAEIPYTAFGETRMVPLAVYQNGKKVSDPENGWDRTYWIEQPEDWYGVDRDGRRTLVVEGKEWRRGLDIDSPDFAVQRWNERYESGTAVDVTRDNGAVLRTVTRSHAWIVGENPVVMVKGIAGCYLLSRVKPVNPVDW